MTGYVRSEYPPWSWSHSRQQTFGSCQRRYYYNYYGSHNGWEFNAPAQAALAYRLKKLSNLYLVLGDALHKVAARIVARVVEGHPVWDADVVEEEIRRNLRRVWKSSRDDLDQFIKRPNRVDMLHEFYYQMGVSESVLDRINRRIVQISQALVASEVWELLGKSDVELISYEQFETFLIDDTPVYAVPDLLFKKTSGEWVIVDWKTGEEAEVNRDQLALYALFVNKRYRVDVEQITARLEYLSLEEITEMHFTSQDLQAVEATAKQSMTNMRELLLDPVQNIPKEKAEFALTTNRERCPWCNFYELCRQELEQSVS